MAGPMGLSEDRQEEGSHAANLQGLAIDRVVASHGNIFQFQPIPDSTPRLQATDLERQRQEAPNQLMLFVAAEDEAGFTARGNQLGLVDPSASYLSAEQRYTEEARNLAREGGRTAVAEGNTRERDNIISFLGGIQRRIAAREETPAEQDVRSAELAHTDASFILGACTTDQCRIDGLNAMAAEGWHAQTLLDLQSEWNLNQGEQEDSPTLQVPLGADGSFEQPLMFAIQENMRRQLDDIRTMQQGGKSSEEVRQSEAYQRLASMAGARRAEQAIATLARGKTSQEAATEATTNIYTRHLLDAGHLNVVPVRRQQVG